MPSWARKQIGLRQLTTQENALREQLLLVELNLRPESPGRIYRARDELRRLLRAVTLQKQITEKEPSRPKMPWSDLIVSVYDWATEGRPKGGGT